MAQQQMFDLFSPAPPPVMRVSKPARSDFSAYAGGEEAEPQKPDPRLPPPEPPTSPEGRYYIVGRGSMYRGACGPLIRKERIRDREIYWIYLPVFGILYFHSDEIGLSSQAEYLKQFDQWKTSTAPR